MQHDTVRIRVFGDSIMKGIVYRKDDRRYETLATSAVSLLERQFSWKIKNTSLFGCTIQKGRMLLQRALHNQIDCDIALLEYGGNDCDFSWDRVAQEPHKEHEPHTPLPLFDKLLRLMVSDLRAHGVMPVLMTLPPIDGRRYFSHICRTGLDARAIFMWLGYDVQTIARYQERYSMQIATVARETGTALVDIRSSFLLRRDCRSLLCEDGIHPNAQGHALIGRTLADFMLSLDRNSTLR